MPLDGDTVRLTRRSRPVHRACFVRQDIEDELLEHQFDVAGAMLAQLLPPRPRLLRPFDDLKGRRFGELLVLGPTVRNRYGRHEHWSRRLWICRCSCGRTVEAEHQRLVRRGIRSCKPCAATATSRSRSTRIAGTTVSELARRAGVTRDAIFARIKKGWPVEALATPKVPTGRRRAA